MLHIVPAWLELFFLTCCIGALVCRLWVLDSSGDEVSYRQELLARLWRLFGIGLFAIIACSIADLLVGALEMSGRPLATVFPLLPAVVLKTHFGRMWLVRIAALILLTIIMRAGTNYRDSRGVLFVMLAFGLVILMTESATGHAADAGDFSIAESVDFLHLLGASAWGGGLFLLSVVVLPVTMKQNDRALVAGAARRFSRIAGVAVGTIAITSLYNAWSYVGSFPAFVKASYGLTVLAKIVLFILLIQFGAYHRYISVPLLQEWAGVSPGGRRFFINRLIGKFAARDRSRRDEHGIAPRFMRSMRIEAILMAGVLLCAALLRHEVPARHFSHAEHAQAGSGHASQEHEAHERHERAGAEPVVMHLETNPVDITAGTPVSLTVRFENGKGRPLQGLIAHHERVLHAVIVGKDLSVFAHIHPEDLGMLHEEMLDTATFPLCYTFPRAGIYLVGIDFATQDGLYSKTAKISVSGGPVMGEPSFDFARRKNFGRYRVSLAVSPRIEAGEETTLSYLIEKDGKPVADLQPYLGAPMHLAVVAADLGRFIHTHGLVPGESHRHHEGDHSLSPEKFGPKIEAVVVFPDKGIYKIFSQVERGGNVLLFDFMVKVE